MFSHNGVQSAGTGVRNVGSVAARGFFELLSRWSRVGCRHKEASTRRNYGTLSTHCHRTQAQFPATPFTAPSGQRRYLSPPATAFATAPKAAVNRFRRPMAEPPELPLFNSIPKTPSSAITETTSSRTLVAKEHKPLSIQLPHVTPSLKPPAYEQDAQKSSTQEKNVEPKPEPLPSLHLRSVMRTLSSSVVVLTTTTSLPRQKDDANLHVPVDKKYRTCRGMTLSSFSTLTLSPEPIITFNIRSPSSTLTAISTCKHFLIHILDASPEGGRIANHFTKGNGKTTAGGTHGGVFRNGQKDEVFGIALELMGGHQVEKETFFALPRLQGIGVRKVLKCELLKGNRHENRRTYGGDYGLTKPLIGVGDHVLVLGRVVEIVDGGEDLDEGETKYGLSYVDGKYRRIGEAISLKGYWPEHEDEGKTF